MQVREHSSSWDRPAFSERFPEDHSIIWYDAVQTARLLSTLWRNLFPPSSFFYSADGGSRFLRNFCNYISSYTSYKTFRVNAVKTSRNSQLPRHSLQIKEVWLLRRSCLSVHVFVCDAVSALKPLARFLNILSRVRVPWLIITGFGLDDWIYWRLTLQTLLITINYNRSQSITA
jgi:hypothetical protein